MGMYTSITAGQVLQSKGQVFHAVGPDMLAYDALEIMSDSNIGALLVVENGHLQGVFSERDYARKVILKGKSSKTTVVRELMSSPPIFVSPETSLKECMVLMTNNHIRHLPVLQNGAIKGVVSIGDVVNTVISEQEMVIEELENYIEGNEYNKRSDLRQ
jgi:CBS domain-containing protein